MKSKNLVIASRNKGKVSEMRPLLEEVFSSIKSLHDYDEVPDAEETGDTYLENAYQKALLTFQHTGEICLADDSGLEIDALGGQPGVHSARFAGPGASDAVKIEKILTALADTPEKERTARFVCVMVCLINEHQWLTSRGVIEGMITDKPKGDNGFGYDPIFVPEGYHVTFASISKLEKNVISHRGRALKYMKELLLNLNSAGGNENL